MHYTAFLFAILASIVAALEFTNPSYSGLAVGQPFAITWTGATGDVTIKLKNGISTDLQDVLVIAGRSFSLGPDF